MHRCLCSNFFCCSSLLVVNMIRSPRVKITNKQTSGEYLHRLSGNKCHVECQNSCGSFLLVLVGGMVEWPFLISLNHIHLMNLVHNLL